MNMFLGIISPFEVTIFFILYALVALTSLYFILRNEKSLFIFFWIVLVLFAPIIGAIIYLCKHFFNRKKSILTHN